MVFRSLIYNHLRLKRCNEWKPDKIMYRQTIQTLDALILLVKLHYLWRRIVFAKASVEKAARPPKEILGLSLDAFPQLLIGLGQTCTFGPRTNGRIGPVL